ncbi:LOW QUALITY PROTEIN: SH3 domain-binding protein 2 [Anguilla rostrata]|uniref:LOW QUALITY PROTEIN: SH3 domain-binding protein 2 n=1 Tax=Anguilla rostrata TaxID=7938 RepID=UPI0030D0CC65
MCFNGRDLRNMATNCTEISWPVPMRAIGAQNLLTMPGGVSKSGYLHKKGGSQFSLLKWPLRFIIIHKGCLYYFKSSTSPSPQGAFSLMGYNRVMRAAEETTSSNVFPFKIVHVSKKHRTWYFSAASEEERKNWMLRLRQEIDYYHDRKESQVESDPDSDADSFYGSVERPLDIRYSADAPEEDYVVDDDEDDEEDYLKPDGSQNSADRPAVPPPSYPPPPVPVQSIKAHPRLENPPLFSKGPPPLPPPAPAKNLPEPVPKKPPPPLPPNKGPPPTLPFAPHLVKPHGETHPSAQKPQPPRTSPSQSEEAPPPCLHHAVPGERPRRLAPPAPTTLPVCKKGSPPPPPPPNHRTKPQVALPPAPPTVPPFKPPMHRPSLGPKPTPMSLPPTKPTPKGPSLQRSCPDGQSFRSSVDEMPTHLRTKSSCSDDSNEDYENVQLPDSVFIDTTDTSDVEKLFKETARSPQDGLYCIRNSGTKTSKVLVVWDVSLKKARNYRLFEENSKIYLEAEITFPSLAALVEHYYSHALPNHGSLCLQKPYGYTGPR